MPVAPIRCACAALLAVPLPSFASAQGCDSDPVPLMDLGTGNYFCFEGGLYTGGVNVPPPGHLISALAEAADVIPLDAAGAFDPASGAIGFINIGFSNPTHEWGAFERQEEQNPLRSPRVALVSCSQGGQSAQLIRDPNASYWNLVQGRLAAAGLTNEQVQVCWLKEVIQGPSGAFPAAALELQDALTDIVGILRDLFPKLRLCYLSSRIYAGFEPGGGSPEPFAYEEGFAVKWLIEAQIAGAPELNWDPDRGPVEAPLLLWGPYLWSNGSQPRSDGFSWVPEDYETDGTHPSPSGEQKVADLLSQFLAADPTAQPWYRGESFESVGTLDALADAHVDATAPDANFGDADVLLLEGAPSERRAFFRFDVSGLPRPFVRAELSFRIPTDGSAGNDQLQLVPDTAWQEDALTWNNQPAALVPLQPTRNISRDGALSLDVTEEVNADADGQVGFALIKNGGVASLSARESGQPPRLVLALDVPGVPYCFCDGSGAPAPCGNAGGVGRGCANSAGPGGRLAAGGRASASSDTLVFQASGLLPGQPALLFGGNEALNGGLGLVFGDGLRCAGVGVRRLGVSTPDGAGAATWGPGRLAQGGWVAGDLAFFQVWYRDPTGSPCGTSFNLSNGSRVALGP